MKKERYDITGMSCAACSARVEKAVRALPGTDEVTVNLLTNSMQVVYDENALKYDNIIEAVEKAGYGAAIHGADQAVSFENKAKDAMETKKWYLVWSIALLLPEMYISMHQMLYIHLGLEVPEVISEIFDGPENGAIFAITQLLLVLPIMFLNKNYYINGGKAMWAKAPNMDSLVGLGSAAALVYGVVNLYYICWHIGHGNLAEVTQYSANLYFESAGMIVTLVSIGKYLETKAKHSTTSALRKLMDYAPQTVTVERDEREVIISTTDLLVGDIVVAKPGTVMAADGVILEGKTSVDESAITGESMPVDKGVGDKVVSGAVNINGFIKYEAQQVGASSTLNKLINLVEEASSSKAPIAKLADKIAGIFVPAVMAVALGTGLVWLVLGYGGEMAFSMGISVLVISCPCALGLATPVAIMAGIGKGAENGILVKSGEILEIVSKISTVVLDKTGTITTGKPAVTKVMAVDISPDELIKRAALLELNSEHPLGQAIVNKAVGLNLTDVSVTDFEAIWGKGVRGRLNGLIHYLGNFDFVGKQYNIEEKYIKEAEKYAEAGNTALYLGGEDKFLGLIIVADTVKNSSLRAISEFKSMGITPVMLTGDNEKTAAAVAGDLGIDRYIAQVRPEKKADYIKELQNQGETVAMIGDGINDAPALVTANAGIAIGAGTDIALESADAILSNNNLLDGVKLVRLSQAVLRNIKENLFWAFFYNIICIPVAAGLLYPTWGIRLTPMIGAAVMSFSSVCVVMNALRLKRLNLAEDVISMDKEPVREGVTTNMEMELKINGMMCMHCQKNVERVLSAIDGVESVTVNLEAGTAALKCTQDIPMDTFAKVITDAGYELVH